MAALSIVLSSSSSQRFGLFTRSPVGDTPAGVVARGVDVENSAAETGRALVIRIREVCRIIEDAGRKPATAISGLVDAIAVVVEERLWT